MAPTRVPELGTAMNSSYISFSALILARSQLRQKVARRGKHLDATARRNVKATTCSSSHRQVLSLSPLLAFRRNW